MNTTERPAGNGKTVPPRRGPVGREGHRPAVVQLSLFDWADHHPPGAATQSPGVVVAGSEALAEAAGDHTSQAGARWVRLPPDIHGNTLRDLMIQCRVDAGHAERYLRMWRERGPWPDEPAVKARFERLYAQEVGFQAFLDDQLAQMLRGDAAGIDVSKFTPEELEAFRQFLEHEAARLDRDVTRVLHPAYPIRETGIQQSLLYRFLLKQKLCSHLVDSLR